MDRSEGQSYLVDPRIDRRIGELLRIRLGTDDPGDQPGLVVFHQSDMNEKMAKILKRVDIYRDGGSISATFECDDLFCQTTLFFQIDWDLLDLAHGSYVRQFKFAELQEHHQFQWTSKITGITLDDSFGCKLRVSWTTARQILSELAPQKARLSDDDQELFDEMTSVANSE